MRGFSKVMLYGNITADPEVRLAKNGKPFSTFSIATNRGWKNKENEKVTQTDFHKVIAFGKLGEITGTYLKKGRAVLVSGRLSNRAYETDKGEKRYVTEVVLDDFNFLSAPKKETEKEEVAA